MRKVEYAILAQAICAELELIECHDPLHPARAIIERIAREFAARASVDRVQFLKACGIEP